MSAVLMPFMIAALFAYLGDPLVNRMETMTVFKRRFSRAFCAALVLLSLLLLILGLLLLLIPLLHEQISLLINKLPQLLNWIQQTVLPWLETHFDIKANINAAQIKTALIANWQQAGNVADKIWLTLSHSTVAVAVFLINLILIPVVTFYLLRDWPRLVAKMKNLAPIRYRVSLSRILTECNSVLSAFFRGQFLVMLALGVIYTAGLMLLKLDVALLVGILIAILSIVPYLGTIIGLAAAAGAALAQFHDIKHIVYVLILFLIGHIIEGMILTPLLIGNRVGLHPVGVIFAILAGGALFGFFGVLLAIPAAAVIMVLLRFFHQRYIITDFYRK